MYVTKNKTGKQNTKMDISRVLLSGAGFLADAYDLFVVNVAVDIMGQNTYQQVSVKTMTKYTIVYLNVISFHYNESIMFSSQ